MPRVGCVQYLNARPLCYFLGDNVTFGHPANVARLLHDKEVEIANVPIMEVFDHPEYEVVDGVCVSSRGPVYSVIVTHEVPFNEIQSVALDSASKTSVMLVQVLMRKMMNHPVIFVRSGEKADAQLRIGDHAMAYRKAYPAQNCFDLGAAWYQMTKLPFVYAVWAMHPRIDNRTVANALRAAGTIGIAARAEIAKSPDEYRYLTQNVRYELGDEEKRGISRFGELLVECGLIDQAPELKWI